MHMSVQGSCLLYKLIGTSAVLGLHTLSLQGLHSKPDMVYQEMGRRRAMAASTCL